MLRGKQEAEEGAKQAAKQDTMQVVKEGAKEEALAELNAIPLHKGKVNTSWKRMSWSKQRLSAGIWHSKITFSFGKNKSHIYDIKSFKEVVHTLL